VRRPVALLGGALLASGCAAGDADTGWEVSVDSSAGYPVVVNTPSSNEIAPTWELVEELRIGAADGTGPDVFGEIRALAVDGQGRIGVLDAQAQEVRVFAPDGTWLRTLGGQGGGPGELAQANGMIATADGNFLVHDPRADRRTVFHPDSGLVRTYPVRVSSYGFVWDAMEDQRGVVWDSNMLADDAGVYTDILQGFDASGAWVDTVRLPAREPNAPDPPGVYHIELENGNAYTTVPYWPGAARAMDPARAFWTKAADVNDYRIARTTFTLDTTLVIESRRTPRPVTASERDSSVAMLRERYDTELEWSRIPDEKPVVQALRVAGDGRLWVRVGAAAGGVTFDVFGPDGIYQGTARTPMTLQRYVTPTIRGDTLWGVVTDDLGVPYVVRAVLRDAAPEAGH
jgi:hypothetical protein